MSISTLPLQDMIKTVVQTASEKLASQRGTAARIKAAASSDDEEEKCENCGLTKEECSCGSKTASQKLIREYTNPKYIQKLASACDIIAANVENIAPPNRGVLGQALHKLAEDGLPEDHGEKVPPTNPEGALETTTGMEGEQEYKKDKPKGEDAAASQAGTALSGAQKADGDTQLDNTMHNAPGQASGSVPTATYPEDGPFHAGSKTAGKIGALLGRAGSAVKGAVKRNPKAVAAGAAGFVAGRASKKTKTAGELARELILHKLAGEDVMKANIEASGDGGALVGDGVLDVLKSDDTPSSPTDGSGYGNDQRSLVGSNQAAIDYTKADAKKPQGRQMSEVLEEPAFSPEHDSKLREQLRNSGEAGVKIAGATAVNFLKQAAAKGVLTQETVERFKQKSANMIQGYGDDKMAGTPSSDPAAKLRSAMEAQKKQKASMGDGSC
jgi:hypothetical protein